MKNFEKQWQRKEKRWENEEFIVTCYLHLPTGYFIYRNVRINNPEAYEFWSNEPLGGTGSLSYWIDQANRYHRKVWHEK